MKHRSAIGENVLKLRHDRGYTQSELAKSAGLSLPTIKNIEGGKDIAKPSTLEKIAFALGVDAALLQLPARRLSDVRFRNVKKLRLKWQILRELSKKLDIYSELERLNGLYLTPLYSGIKEKSPIRFAAAVRKKLHLTTKENIVDILSVINSLGIKLLKVNVDTDKFLGLSVGELDGGPAVFVNVNWRFAYEMVVFAIVRESAHFILHPIKDKDRVDIETEEAETFASHFLMPDEALLSHWNGLQQIHWALKVVKLRDIFSVPCLEIIKRMQSLGAAEGSLREENFLRLFNGNASPLSLKGSLNIEERFNSLVLLSVNRKLLTAQAAAEILNLPLNAVELWAQG
ncbi:MAG: helix-turn-helix domain-containing protein [Deferribacteraceae bacterium]|jgi:transcriptional regulator with XRE-family HTH domain|nr:helix-turn-helix domain-containing protein [Deferribacteraceae bacterium]